MPQQTNLNVAPYFDDFDSANDFHKVLFKPGYPVQARELTTLQSILQNQVEKFGQHFFKEGAKVIPGNVSYNKQYYAVQLSSTYQGVPISAYIDQLVGLKITGARSGVTAVVDKILLAENSERGYLTLYVNYLSSNTQDNSTQTFLDGEDIYCGKTIVSGLLGNSAITAGSPVATTIPNGSTATGSSFSVQDGVYFIRGNFVNVSSETLVLDQYDTDPSYRVGFFVNEQVINSDMDQTLNDNSQGFNNYSAPGADRLKISVNLFKKTLSDLNDDNFVELAVIENGIIKTKAKSGSTSGSIFAKDLNDSLAKRTYETFGDYLVRAFDITVLESLNDNQGNNGVFNAGQSTPGGVAASDNDMLYKVGPGKSYVKGYPVQTLASTFLDSPKTRTTKTLKQQSLTYNTGSTLSLNRVYGSAEIGVGNTYVVSLRDTRVGANGYDVPGKEIGMARVYDFKLESGSYNASNGNLNEWDLSLFDVQTTSEITVNEPTTLSIPTYVKGAQTGATAFLRDAVTAGVALTVYERQGEFNPNEPLIFNGEANGRIAIAITNHTISDVKSVYATDNGLVGVNTFSADILPTVKANIGIASITQVKAGISTITSTNVLFPKAVEVGNLIKFSNLANSDDPTLAKVISVGSNLVTIQGVETVAGICNGVLPASTINVTDLTVQSSDVQTSSDDKLFTWLPKHNIATVDLTDASITIRKVFTVNIAGNQIDGGTIPTAGENETFLPFDEERYSLTRSNGATEVLTSDKVQFVSGSGGRLLQIYNLGAADTGATLTATLTKIKPKAKVKIRNRVQSIVINKSKNDGSGIGATTLNNGLEYGNYPFGTRVEDSLISLNTPDIITIHSIFESSDTQDPSAPKLTLSSILSASTTTEEYVVGELLTGQSSGAAAIVAGKLTSNQISVLYKNDNVFKEGESILSSESQFTATITTLNSPSFDISNNYSFDNGQEATIYNYGAIEKKADADAPTKKLIVYFASGSYDATDTGDITTVESYDTYNYGKEIPMFNGMSNSDIIDIRPRVQDYSVAVNTRSPFEFLGRTFSTTSNSAANVLASDEALLTTFSYYQGRIDRIFINRDSSLQVKYGTPADKPDLPEGVSDALELAQLTLPPYIYDVKDVSVEFLKYKKFKMSDLKDLEDRVKSLEYYTTLSMLENATSNMFIPDQDGFNRFKSGFFVDNFTSVGAQETAFTASLANSIDLNEQSLRPKHYTNSLSLIPGPVVNVDTTADAAFSLIEGVNVRRTGDIVSLDYAEVEYVKQSFGTRSESVTPFMISFWQGTVEMTPATDNWVDTVRLEARVINNEGNFAAVLADARENLGFSQDGFAGTIWNSWQTNWQGTRTTERRVNRGTTTSTHSHDGGRSGSRTSTTVFENERLTIESGTQSRTGTRRAVVEQFDRESLGDRTISRDIVLFLRSRNIQIVAKRIKPLTQIYAFFDGKDVSKYVTPKLLEIQMTSGIFQVGESVVATQGGTGLGDISAPNTSAGAIFRVAQPKHKGGPYNIPTSTFSDNPYTYKSIPSSYSASSTLLNIDVRSMADEAQGDYYGWVESGMVLVGQSSGAQAKITNLRLISDTSATLIGSFFVPNPNSNTHPRFETGKKVLNLTNDPNNNPDTATTTAEETFESSGILETIQEDIVSTRNARVETQDVTDGRSIERTINTEVIPGSRTTSTRSWGFNNRPRRWGDPLAQTVQIEDPEGIFLTRVDLFFRSRDDMNIPFIFQIRTTENGAPVSTVLPNSEVTLNPSEINLSADGSVATPIQFESPVFLEGGNKEYALTLLSSSTKYAVYISRVGENDLITEAYVSQQPYLGSLFKSQNASIWEPSQWEDLKFTLYRADFLTSGTFDLYNADLKTGNNQIPYLNPNALVVNSRQLRVGLGTTVADSALKVGNTVTQLNNGATGNLVSTAGIATGALSITRAGLGFTPASGHYQYDGVNLTTLSGNGTGAKANITIANGVALGATFSVGGHGYQVGDVLGITSIGNNNLGLNARLSIATIGDVNELILDNVQGDYKVGAANTVMFTNSAGVSTALNFSNGGDVQVGEVITASDGVHIKVNHNNHGMYFNDNKVRIFGVKSDIKPTKLTVEYKSDAVGALSVEDASAFSIFENVGVGTTNTGFLQIGDEVVEYTAVSGNNIGGNITRSVDKVTSIGSSTLIGIRNYPVGTPVYKYELSDVNLLRINKTHDLASTTATGKGEAIGFDHYNLEVDMSTTFNDNNTSRAVGTSFPNLYLNNTKSTGGNAIQASQNIAYDLINPAIQTLSVPGTTMTGEIRTVTSQSIDGNELPWVDNGFESITLNDNNWMNSPRLIASNVNAENKLSALPGNKSTNLKLTLGTTDSRLSPLVDLQRSSLLLTTNRVNNVITDFATDPRVNEIGTDPTAFRYVSKEVELINPATSIRIMLEGHLTSSNDIRAFYAISDKENFNPIFVPFPGYANLDQNGQVITPEKNNGQSDTFVAPTNEESFNPSELEFNPYEFTIDNLPSFKSYRIKIVATSTSQVYVPQIKALRVIAFA
tara:strand:- start:1943 stop:9496 length:7554 start_codon:yes stop_codon:yes gene_type:complete